MRNCTRDEGRSFEAGWVVCHEDAVRCRPQTTASCWRTGTPATVTVQRETRTIPIVLTGVTDPVASGIVARLDRPSGNITGFANQEATLGGKWLELLSEIAPFGADTTLS